MLAREGRIIKEEQKARELKETSEAVYPNGLHILSPRILLSCFSGRRRSWVGRALDFPPLFQSEQLYFNQYYHL
jgi:G:T/U-mismatch repair DNA glycosylase